jgi:hypothetical protein
MYCVRCGAALQPGHNFCAGCGSVIGNLPGNAPPDVLHAAAVPAPKRLSEQLRLLAICWFAMSAFRMIPGLFIVTMSGFIGRFLPPDVPGFVPWIIEWVGFLFIGGAAIGLIAGQGLLGRAPWARMLTIVLGCFSLFDVPFGTALGVYTLWVLLPAEAEQEFRAA